MKKMVLEITVTEEILNQNPGLEEVKGVDVGEKIYVLLDTDRPKEPPHNG